MKKRNLAVIAAAAVMFGACVPSVNPFYTENDVVFDARLLGEWREKGKADEPEVWKFEQSATNGYILTIIEKHGKEGRFEARLFKLKEELFLDIIPADCEYATNQADMVAASMFPGHLLIRRDTVSPIVCGIAAASANLANRHRTRRSPWSNAQTAWTCSSSTTPGENDSMATRKAYYLRANQTRIVTGKKPIFVNPSVAERMQPIPIFISNAGFTNMTSQPAPYAVMAKESRAFTLYLEGGRGEAFTLPVYSESSGTVMRVVFTPLAVAGDTVVVAAAGAVVCIIGLAESGTSFDVH